MQKSFFFDEKGQSSFEYVLMAAGAILVVTIALIMMRRSVLPAINEQANQNLGNFSNLIGSFNKTK